MNRLQKKCFVASAGVHLLLALILLIGPAFVSSKAGQDDPPVLDFVPIKTVDELVSGGGNPKAKPPAALPVQPPAQPPPASTPPPEPQPQPLPEKIREPDPPKHVEPARPEEDSIAPTKDSKPRKVEISKTLITRKHDTGEDKRAKEEAQARAEAKAVVDARRRLAKQIGQVAENIGNELSGGTSVELKGPGGGGVPYANWRSAIKTIYQDAWLLPDGVVDNEATTAASVTVAKDGTVISSHIIHLSGDSVVDRSVQAALDRVRKTLPLPDTALESQRTVVINFNVKAKRGLG
ncbi:MAG TPA: TonB C-terminal domain-containing protein [Patescibacteria group bacterium]|nr:TonB C-terminal domain-containing protein [Patescibacteria group bacterium]